MLTPAVCFSTRPAEMDQAILDQAIGRVVVGLRPRRAVEVGGLLTLAIVEQRVPDRLRIADEHDAAGPGLARSRHPRTVTRRL